MVRYGPLLAPVRHGRALVVGYGPLPALVRPYLYMVQARRVAAVVRAGPLA